MFDTKLDGRSAFVFAYEQHAEARLAVMDRVQCRVWITSDLKRLVIPIEGCNMFAEDFNYRGTIYRRLSPDWYLFLWDKFKIAVTLAQQGKLSIQMRDKLAERFAPIEAEAKRLYTRQDMTAARQRITELPLHKPGEKIQLPEAPPDNPSVTSGKFLQRLRTPDKVLCKEKGKICLAKSLPLWYNSNR